MKTKNDIGVPADLASALEADPTLLARPRELTPWHEPCHATILMGSRCVNLGRLRATLCLCVVIGHSALGACRDESGDSSCARSAVSSLPLALRHGAAWGGSQGDLATAVSWYADGLVVAGGFVGQVDFDPSVGSLEHYTTSSRNYVSRFDPTGALVWTVPLGGTGGNLSPRLAVDADGPVYVAGVFGGSFDFDPGSAEDVHDAGGEHVVAAFVTRLEADGSYGWTRSFVDAMPVAPFIELRDDGTLLVVGNFQPGPESDESLGPRISVERLVLDPSDGSTVEATRLGQGQVQGLAMRSDGGIVLALGWMGGGGGPFLEAWDAAGETLWAVEVPFAVVSDIAVGPDDAVVACAADGVGGVLVLAIEPDGASRWSVGLDGPGLDRADAIAVRPDGTVLVAGAFFRYLSWGAGAPEPEMAAEQQDAFLVVIDPEGAVVGVRSWGGSGEDLALDLAVGPSGQLAIAGSFQETVGLSTEGGNAVVQAAGYGDSYVIVLGEGDEPRAASCAASDTPDPTITSPLLAGSDLPQNYQECVERGGTPGAQSNGWGICTFWTRPADDPDLFAQCIDLGGGEIEDLGCRIHYSEDRGPCFGNACD